MSDSRPVLFVTNYAPAFRRGAFAALHASENVEFALIGGAVRHGGSVAAEAPMPFPTRAVAQNDVFALAASGRYRCVVAGLSGRLAPAGAYLGARHAGVPFVLWATLWAHPVTPAHLLSYGPVRFLYSRADAVVTYGHHVSAYVRSRGARGPVVEAPQSVDNEFWSARVDGCRHAGFQATYVGRLEREKGVDVLIDAWRAAGLGDSGLVLAGDGPLRSTTAAGASGDALDSAAARRSPRTSGVLLTGALAAEDVRRLYAGSDVVIVPSVRTRSFREPWGLTVNEAFNQGVAVVASNEVGAVAGGLVRDQETGLVVTAGERASLVAALRRLRADSELRSRLGGAGRAEIQNYSHTAWAAGFTRALAVVGTARAVVA
ncbi:MAG: glycosyltransferase family 4 protein [Actinomycetota bacterium]|nr:glycosyltransferase family 4 protein [Actinomycetota bacterium]